MNRLFYHGMQPRRSSLCKIKTMLEIIDSGSLKSNRLLGNNLTHGYNGLDYISVCSREKIYKYFKKEESAFNLFIKNNFCFILSGDISVIKPKYLDWNCFEHYDDLVNYINSFPGAQFSDLFDEWQVKDEIPLDYVVGLGLPLQSLSKIYNLDDKMMKEIERLYMFARTFGWDIVDSDSFFSFYNYEKGKVKKK